MEMNRGDAEKCYKIANEALLKGNLEKAEKFIMKSMKLYPTDRAKNLLTQIKNGGGGKANATHAPSSAQRVPDTSKLHGSSAEEKPPTFTPAQKKLVDNINRCKDYYDILGVSKDANESDLKKAYRKMALQLHPDKNTAPGATEAFKAVGKAFSILNDATSRKRYDMYGPEGVTTRRRRRSSSGDEYEYNDGEFDPNELFNMFFGGGFPNGNVRVFRRGNTYYYDRRNGNQRPEAQQNSNFGAIFQLLPIIIIFVLSILGNLLTPDPAFSLRRHGEYAYRTETVNLKVPYFVKSDFSLHYKKNTKVLRRLEDSIESEYIENLRNSCYQERVNKESIRRKGVYFGSADMVKRSETMKTPSCDRLQKLFPQQL